jgi:hypothetical protein
MENIITLIVHHNDFIQSLFLAYAAGNLTLILAIAGAGYKIVSDAKRDLKERFDESSELFSNDWITAMNMICDVNEDSKEQTKNIIVTMKDIEAIRKECERRRLENGGKK